MYSTGDNIESEAERCQEALGKVLDATAREMRICARSQRWWNGEIKPRTRQLVRDRRRRRRSVATGKAKEELQKSIRLANDRMWN